MTIIANCYEMIFGLLCENIDQKSSLDELQKLERKRQDEDAKLDFQMQMKKMMFDFK